MKKKVNNNTYDIRCSRAKQRQNNVQKIVLHLHSFFLVTRHIVVIQRSRCLHRLAFHDSIYFVSAVYKYCRELRIKPWLNLNIMRHHKVDFRLYADDTQLYRKSSIKPPPGGGLFISSPFVGGGGLIEAGDLLEMGGLFNLEKTMVSVLHKELEQKVEKLKNKRDGGHAAEDQNQIRTSSW